MATYYGDNNHLEDIRTKMVAQVTALIAQMDTDSTDPEIDYVYSTHHGTLALQFNSVSVGVAGVDQSLIAVQSSPSGPVLDALYQIELRVMIGNLNVYHDEIKVGRLCQSLLNWMQENRNLGDQWHIHGESRAELDAVFDDTHTIGGLVTLVAERWQSHSAA